MDDPYEPPFIAVAEGADDIAVSSRIAEDIDRSSSQR
jgi:hypothetical protein